VGPITATRGESKVSGGEVADEGGRYVPESGEELSQEDQLRHMTDTGAKSVEATEEDEDEVLRSLYGEPDEDGVYRGDDA